DGKPTEKAAAGSPKSGPFLPDIEDLMTTRGCDGCPLKSRCGIGKGKTAKEAGKEE
ncbi:hypothetical protein A2U01_0055078, partial [Trifolium medium]|nr:hypothetical protein [Trifolium medium]